MHYFILQSDEDGTQIDGPFTEAQVLKMITPDKHGETHYGTELHFLDHIPENDGPCWMNVSETSVLIIKGEIVIPKPTQAVTQYKLP